MNVMKVYIQNEEEKYLKHYVKNNRIITILWLLVKCVIPQEFYVTS